MDTSNSNVKHDLFRELKFEVSNEVKNQWLKSRDTIKKYTKFNNYTVVNLSIDLGF